MQVIYTGDALAGSGKTHSAITYALRAAAHGLKIAIVQPTKDLLRQSYEDAVARDSCNPVRITRIDSDEFQLATKSKIVAHLKESQDGVGEILFITHAAFFGLPYWHKRERWKVIIDEVPQVVDDLTVNIPDTHEMLTSALELTPYNAAYSILRVKDQSRIAAYAENKREDRVFQVLQRISQHLLDPNRTVYANTANWHRVCNDATQPGQHQLSLYSMLHPSVFWDFNSVTIMGAMFEHSLLYLLWSESPNMEFRAHKPITRGLRYNEHKRGELLTIEYLMDHQWSKTFRDRRLESGVTVLDRAVAEAQRSMAGKEFIYVANKDVEDDLASKFSGGQPVSSFCHGLNKYQHIDQLAFLSALNPAPGYFAFLESMGINGDELRRAHYLLSVYQAAMRISIRDPQNDRPKHVLVMDRDGANHLASYFLDCKVVKNPNMPELPARSAGREKVWKDDAARHRARRDKERQLKELAALCGDLSARSISIVPSIYSKDVFHHGVEANELLIDELRDALETELSDKHKNILISPARFRPSKAKGTTRGIANIESIFGIWLDNDGGGITHEEFRSVFPGMRMVCFPTFSGGDRYRVFIPTTQPMTVGADEKIKRMLMQELYRQGFKDKPGRDAQRPHGFDVSKITPSSLFYLPCRQPGQATWFADYPGEELDPATWIARPTIAGMFDTPEPAPGTPSTPIPSEIPTGMSPIQAVRLKLAKG